MWEFGYLSNTLEGALLQKPEKIHSAETSRGLTSGKARLKYREIPANPFLRVFDEGNVSVSMTSKPFPQPQNAGKQPCKHPRVQIVSREEDAEFVECLECREIFEASELKDMSIEESAESEAQE